MTETPSVPLVPVFASHGRLAVTELELVAWGERLGRAVAPPLMIAISGELGAGKTTLVRAICRGYGVADDVTSPTFTLVHEYTEQPTKGVSSGPLSRAHMPANSRRSAGTRS